MTGPHKKPTCTRLVLDYLVGLDDFATRGMIISGSGVGREQMSATLHDLKRHRAIGVMEANGELWFYATPADDKRSFRIDSIKEEIRRPRPPCAARGALA